MFQPSRPSRGGRDERGVLMFGIVIIAHGGLAGELLAATEHVVGQVEKTKAIGIGPHDDLTQKQADIRNAVEEVRGDAGAILVTDMFGGTPSNLSIGCMETGAVDVIYGANLPMLIKLAKSRHLPVADAVRGAMEAGKKYINAQNVTLD